MAAEPHPLADLTPSPISSPGARLARVAATPRSCRRLAGAGVRATVSPPASSDRWSASSTRTTRRPSGPPVRGAALPRRHSRKCSSSIRSGSRREIAGLRCSPERAT